MSDFSELMWKLDQFISRIDILIQKFSDIADSVGGGEGDGEATKKTRAKAETKEKEKDPAEGGFKRNYRKWITGFRGGGSGASGMMGGLMSGSKMGVAGAVAGAAVEGVSTLMSVHTKGLAAGKAARAYDPMALGKTKELGQERADIAKSQASIEAGYNLIPTKIGTEIARQQGLLYQIAQEQLLVQKKIAAKAEEAAFAEVSSFIDPAVEMGIMSKKEALEFAKQMMPAVEAGKKRVEDWRQAYKEDTAPEDKKLRKNWVERHAGDILSGVSPAFAAYRWISKTFLR